jgi:hypothetical protein
MSTTVLTSPDFGSRLAHETAMGRAAREDAIDIST